MDNRPLDKVLLAAICILCLVATLLFLAIPGESLDTGLVYRGF